MLLLVQSIYNSFIAIESVNHNDKFFMSNKLYFPEKMYVTRGYSPHYNATPPFLKIPPLYQTWSTPPFIIFAKIGLLPPF